MSVVPFCWPKCKRTLRQNSDNNLHKCRTKLAFLIRILIFLTVIFIFYSKFVLDNYLKTRNDYNLELSYYSHEDISQNDIQTNLNEFLERNRRSVEIVSNKENCTPAAILEFPSDGFTHEQRQHGWIIVHIIIAFYCFWTLAVICDEYFVPAVEIICVNFKMEKDVIGATFMAAAISGPALFLNCVGTFITGGDIGVSTIVGSAVFNMLAVPACCGLFVVRCIKLDWWSLTRDCLIYFLATLGLVITLYDGKVYWYEALSLVIAYFLYMTVMYYNDKVARTARQLISKYRQRKSRIRPFREVNEITPLLVSRNNNSSSKFGIEQISTYQALDVEKSQLVVSSTSVSSTDSDFADSPWQCSEQMNAIEFIFRWPITFILWLTIPDSRKNSKKKYFTFLMSIIWIGVLSYVVTFVITVIGDTLEIPDSIMGLTILAAGMSVPEALSSIIVSKHGQGAMGISNSIGSNTFDILLSLGLPWFIKAYFMPTNPDERWITLNSSGLSYSAICLLTTLVCLYAAFVVNKFALNRKIGVVCAIMYFIFLMFASMIELNVFFPVNLPVCSH